MRLDISMRYAFSHIIYFQTEYSTNTKCAVIVKPSYAQYNLLIQINLEKQKWFNKVTIYQMSRHVDESLVVNVWHLYVVCS